MPRDHRLWIIIISLLGCSALGLGAAGAHTGLSADAKALAEQASTFQLIHALALLVTLALPSPALRYARLIWTAGILLFCGSLYTKAFGLFAHAPLAPFGGTLLMAGWLALLTTSLSKTK